MNALLDAHPDLEVTGEAADGARGVEVVFAYERGFVRPGHTGDDAL